MYVDFLLFVFLVSEKFINENQLSWRRTTRKTNKFTVALSIIKKIENNFERSSQNCFHLNSEKNNLAPKRP
jgi:hypothetical protein